MVRRTIAILVLTVSAAAQQIPVANPSFETDPADGAAWALSSAAGAWTSDEASDGAHAIALTGTGDDTNYWRQDIPLEANQVYALEFAIKDTGGGDGTPITGPVFCNRDVRSASDHWEEITSYFVAPDTLTADATWLRFGQWHREGAVFFDNIRLWVAQPVYRRFGDVVLGAGEQIHGTTYEFEPRWWSMATNQSRPMAVHDCYFNTNRFEFGAGSHIVLHHEIAGHPQTSASVSVATAHNGDAALVLEVSRDGNEWHSLASITKDADHAAIELPADLFPTAGIWVRITAPSAEQLHQESPLGSVTLSGYRFKAALDGEPLEAVGATSFVQVRETDPDVAVDIIGLDNNELVLELDGVAEKSRALEPTLTLTHPGMDPQRARTVASLGDEPTRVVIPFEAALAGAYRYTISLGADSPYQATGEFMVSDLFATSYGALLPASTDDVALWWASSGWKINQTRSAPDNRSGAVRISAARNERDAAQFVLNPQEPLANFVPTPSALVNAAGHTIPADALDVLRVHYLNVTRPTDSSSVAAPWPDPLPPIDAPLTLEANQNHPFWLRVFVPKGTPASHYTGTVELTADGYAATVPVDLEVFDFELPDRPTCVSAFGFDAGNIFRYHNVTDPEQRRLVIDKYLQNFSRHRISPYDPAPLDDPAVTWPDVKPGDTIDPAALTVSFEWAAWDAGLTKAFGDYHFTSMRLPVAGMGSGTFHSRVDPQLLGFADGTPEYKALFDSYWKQLQEHLREKGWLDKGYVYWFDEPDPKDYDFVMNGFRKLREAAPDITRMLTEQVEEGLVGGPNLWCPISDAYTHDESEARRALGEKSWWYVCTGPKAPYATLFIDHAATDLRVWLWQTWQRNIDGILVWQSNYWTSDSAYPDHPQNPYDDPMGWTSGYSTKAGQRLPWGNGDGRFIYPPLAAANADSAEPVLLGPVDSIRWEMLRDGVEDYEYMAILERLIDAQRATLSETELARYTALLEVPEAITKDMTTFTKDPAPIEARREELARAIEALEKTP